MRRVITLLTDFGYDSYFVAAMKGVILSINPEAVIVDITHSIPSFNIWKAAFTLWSVYKYFPKGSIHVVVVDPGVGTERKGLVIKTRNYIFVGPDNGVLTLAALEDGVEGVWQIEDIRLMRPWVSSTFHGRDVFAPIAAYLSLGLSPSRVGPMTEDFVRLEWPKNEFFGNAVRTKVVYVDKFGNAYTGLRAKDVEAFGLKHGDLINVEVPGKCAVRAKFVKSYGYAEKGEVVAVINSEGFLELAINMGSFAEKFGISELDDVIIRI